MSSVCFTSSNGCIVVYFEFSIDIINLITSLQLSHTHYAQMNQTICRENSDCCSFTFQALSHFIFFSYCFDKKILPLIFKHCRPSQKFWLCPMGSCFMETYT